MLSSHTYPIRDVTPIIYTFFRNFPISTHTPHAGRDVVANHELTHYIVSTHTPHAGRDVMLLTTAESSCFLLTRPMRDVTRNQILR